MRKFLLIAFCMFATLAFWGKTSDQSRRVALRQLVERADSGDGKSLYDLALLHDTGFDSIPVDSVRSTLLYRLSAEKGYAPACNYLGFRYYKGEAVSHNVDSALFWISKAAESGDIKAAGNLGFLLSQAPDVSHDYDRALSLLRGAAEAGLPSAKSNLADMLREGLGTSPDTLAASKLYEQAMAAGIADAEMKLIAMMGFNWQKMDSREALAKGLEYLRIGAPNAAAILLEEAAGNNEPQALSILGFLYSRGLGVPYDYKLSQQYFLKGALAGNPSAQFIVAELLDFFPDVFSEEEAQTIIREFNPLEISADRVSDPYFWYQLAAESSTPVTDSDTAYRLLLAD